MSKINYKCSSFCSFYKAEQFIQGYIANMLEQSIFSQVEFVFVNCASSENEEQYILPLLTKYPNIKYIKLEKDPGLYAAWNIAIQNCSSELITNWNADDRKNKQGLEILIEALDDDPSLDMVYGQLAMSTIPNETYDDNLKTTFFKLQEPSLCNFLRHNSPHCMPMWRKRIHKTCGYFNENYACVSDSELWLKLLVNKGKIKLVNKVIGVYYFNPKGRSTDPSNTSANAKESLAMRQEIIQSLGNDKLGIDDLLSCEEHSEFHELYNNRIIDGIKHIQNKKIIFAGLCRSTGDKLEHRINYIINNFSKYCPNFKIVLFENDSRDNTKQILQKLQSKYSSHFEYISQDLGTPQYSSVKDKNRIELLSYYRTLLQDHIRKNYNSYDYTILFDTDFLDISISGILNSFGWLKTDTNIDAMAGYSFSLNAEGLLWNYDSWAYRLNSWRDSITVPVYPLVQNYNTMLAFGLSVLPKGSPPITVNSAFGGTAIYKMEDYLFGKYDSYDCEHVTFHKYLSTHKSFKLFVNPSQLMLLE